MYRKLYFIGIVAYLYMLALSVLFYKERAIFLDCSYMIFQLVRTGAFCIEVYRFGDAFAQILPLLGYKLGQPLSVITLGYSVGLLLSPITCYIICGSVLKQYRFALVILLVSLLFATHTFYWTQSQVPQGIAPFMLIFALIWGKPLHDIRPLHKMVIAISLFVLAFFHPLMAVILAYSTIFFLLRNDGFLNRRVLSLMAGFFISMLILKAVFFRTPYERHSLSGLKNVVRLFPDYFTMYSNTAFLRHCVTAYYWIPISFCAIVAYYISTRSYKKLAFSSGAVLGYLLLVNIMYPTTDTPQFYIENLYAPIGLFLALPIVFDLLPVLELKKTGVAIVSLIVLTGCIRIYAAHAEYTSRLNWERSFLAANADKKIIADAKKVNAGILQMLWGTPYEFWQLSTIETGRSASIIIDDDPPHRDWAKGKTRELVVNWNIFSYKDLNPKYFIFLDTTSGYIIEKNQTPNP